MMASADFIMHALVALGFLACFGVLAWIELDGRRVAREADARAYEAIRKAGCGPVSYRNLRQ